MIAKQTCSIIKKMCSRERNTNIAQTGKVNIVKAPFSLSNMIEKK